jgi:hypothetical protein
MAKQYSVYNGPAVTTTAPVPVATGTSVKTMIQLSTSASKEAKVIEWWSTGDASAAAVPGTAELLFHGSGAATVTAYVTADIRKYEPNSVNCLLTLGTANSGYTASAEGTPAGGTFSIVQQAPPTSGVYIQYPFGREPEMAASTFLRLRNKFAATVNTTCGVAWEE